MEYCIIQNEPLDALIVARELIKILRVYASPNWDLTIRETLEHIDRVIKSLKDRKI